MPRVNIYLNEATSRVVAAWKDKISLSEVFARALQDEISSIEDGKDIKALAVKWRSPTRLETDLRIRFGLIDAVVVSPPSDDDGVIRRELGVAAARYIDMVVSNGMDINVCGGRQSWEVIRNLGPRRISATVRAYGVPLTERGVHHLHSNTLATILALLYQPRSQAELVVGGVDPVFLEVPPDRPQLVLSSCSVFDPHSAFSQLLGSDAVSALREEHAAGEFAYSFWDTDGRELPELALDGSRRFTRAQLGNLSKNPANSVMLISGGIAKRPAIREVVTRKLCNVLVTTKPDAEWLLFGEATND
jgi:DNA-binding transcriptional regulator LsrR (DeoR family)